MDSCSRTSCHLSLRLARRPPSRSTMCRAPRAVTSSSAFSPPSCTSSISSRATSAPSTRCWSSFLSSATAEWMADVHEWESTVEGHLPIRALRETLALDDSVVLLLFAIGLIEEDPRFGFVIECAQPVSPQQHRPTLGLLMAWWREASDTNVARSGVRTLLDNGLLQVLNADAPRLQWVFQSPPAVWDALRGEMAASPAPWLRFVPPSELTPLSGIVLPDGVRRAVDSIPALLRSGDMRGVIVRGPRNNGRGTVVRSIARSLGRGVLTLRGPIKPDDERWPLI